MPCRSAFCAEAEIMRPLAPAAAAPAKRLNARRRLSFIDLRPLRHFGRFRRVPPPDGRERRRPVFWHSLRMAKTIPARGALLTVGPLRYHVEIPQQRAVECLAGGNQIIAVLGEDYALDQPVDCRILDANQIARTGLVGRGRTPEVALLVTGRQRLAP